MTDRWLRVAPPLAALMYPALVWSGPAIWPPLLVLALLPPALAVWAAVRLATHHAPAARAVAHVAVGAPALYSLLGGLLDWQQSIPLTSVRVWIPLWLVLAAIAWREPWRARDTTPRARAPSRLAIVHGVIALPIVAFALAHLVNHMVGIAGGDVHVAVMHALRRVYRAPYVESVLLGCVAGQVITGVILIARRLARSATAIETLQGVAGAYLALFFASHVTAVLRTRSRGRETDWSWLTSSDLFRDPWSARLVPYYVLGVLAIGLHLACAVRTVAIGHGVRAVNWSWAIVAATGLAALVATVIMVALAS